MFKPEKEYLIEYAKLAVEAGCNVQKGQPLEITATIDAIDLVRECVKIAYEKGASYVNVNYIDDVVDRLDYEYQSEETLSEIAPWLIEKVKYNISKNYCRLIILGNDPDSLKGLDTEKIQKANIAKLKAMDTYRYYSMNNIGQWSIVAYPGVAWAKKVFPNCSNDEALELLWKAILKTSRCEINKTMDNWIKHNNEIKEHSKKMNEYSFEELYFKNSLGTDLHVGLVNDHIWEGGSEVSKGIFKCEFNPNIPTEEIFTMPDCCKINGRVFSTKPLSYNGKIIPEFNLTFKDGKVVDYEAKENIEVLKNILETDEGSKSLGEVALISHDSPISNSGILFYETLFDENASCHLALGDCYPTNIKDGSKMSKEDLYRRGGNNSINHVDFMFGSEDLFVEGITKNKQRITIFIDGNFVF